MSPRVTGFNLEPNRREFLQQTTVVAAGVAGLAVLGLPRAAKAAPPVWATVPNQTWIVGVPVYLDLATYCTDADGDPLTFGLDQSLPPGLTLSGSVISGTPTDVFGPQQFVASADDGKIGPQAPTNLSVQ